MKTIEVEFTGVDRVITGLKTYQLTLEDDASYRDVIQALAERFPGMVNILIAPDLRSFLSANLFNRNGEEPILPDCMDDQPADGDRLIIIYFMVGG
jgi:hypothetical protein